MISAGASASVGDAGGRSGGSAGGRDQLGEAPRRPRRRDHLEVVAVGDDRDGVGVADDVLQLAVAIQDVHRHDDGAEPEDGEVDGDERRRVAEVQADAAAAADPARRQHARQPVDFGIELAEGQRAVAVERRRIAAAGQ